MSSSYLLQENRTIRNRTIWSLPLNRHAKPGINAFDDEGTGKEVGKEILARSSFKGNFQSIVCFNRKVKDFNQSCFNKLMSTFKGIFMKREQLLNFILIGSVQIYLLFKMVEVVDNNHETVNE